MKLSCIAPDFCKLMDGISTLVCEAKFNLSPNGLRLASMDSANVAMVILDIKKTFFSEFIVDNEETICVNLNNLKQILKRGTTSDKLVIELENKKLKITLNNQRIRTFYLPLIDIEEKKQKEPSLEFKTISIMNSKFLSSIISDCSIVGESVQIKSEEGVQEILFDCDGDISRYTCASGEDKVQFIQKESCKAKYSIEYLKKITTADKLSDTVKVMFSQDYPLKLVYGNEQFELSFILAPRMDN